MCHASCVPNLLLKICEVYTGQSEAILRGTFDPAWRLPRGADDWIRLRGGVVLSRWRREMIFLERRWSFKEHWVTWQGLSLGSQSHNRLRGHFWWGRGSVSHFFPKMPSVRALFSTLGCCPHCHHFPWVAKRRLLRVGEHGPACLRHKHTNTLCSFPTAVYHITSKELFRLLERS